MSQRAPLKGQGSGRKKAAADFDACPINVKIPIPRGIEGIMPCRDFQKFAQTAAVNELQRQASMAIKDQEKLQALLKKVAEAQDKMLEVKKEKREATSRRRATAKAEAEGRPAPPPTPLSASSKKTKPVSVDKLATQIATLSRQVTALPNEQQAQIQPAIAALSRVSQDFQRTVGAPPEAVAMRQRQEAAASRNRLAAENRQLRIENEALRAQNLALQKQLDEYEMHFKFSELTFREMQTEYEKLERINAELMATIAALETQFAEERLAAEARVRGLEADIAALPRGMAEAELAQVEQRLKERQSQVAKRAASVDRLGASFDALEQEMAQSKVDAEADLEARLREIEARMASNA